MRGIRNLNCSQQLFVRTSQSEENVLLRERRSGISAFRGLDGGVRWNISNGVLAGEKGVCVSHSGEPGLKIRNDWRYCLGGVGLGNHKKREL